MNETSIGERLRRAREAVPASLYEAARQTKIRVDFIESMERDSFRFVWSAYARGMVRAYARWLNLDEDEIGAEFDRIYGETATPSVKQMLREPAQRPPRRRSPKWIIAAALAASTLLVLSLVGVMNPPGPTRIATPPAAPGRSVETSQAPAAVAQAPAAQGVKLVVTITGERCWVSALADGAVTPIFEDTMFRGDVQTLEATDRLEVRFGNLGSVSISLNGRDLGTPGGLGTVGTLVFRPDTTTFVKAGA